MSNRFVLILVGLFIIFGGIFWVTKKKANAPAINSNAQPTNHVEGSGQKHVTLIEYGDYQCPACGEYYPIVKQVFASHQNDIIFQFRNFPLYQIHQNAFAGARAAEAAGLQNKYWEMHDLLYENQTTWSASSSPSNYFVQYAAQLGLNTTKFTADMNSQAVNDTINADIKAGQDLGADATPTFVLDGKKIDNNPQDLSSFNQLIDNEIKAKNP